MKNSPETAGGRAELMMIRSRYDDGAVHPSMYKVIKNLEQDIAWGEHQRQEKKGPKYSQK